VRFVRAAAAEVIGLFVGDWAQTLVSIAILALGWLVLSRIHTAGLAFAIAVALAVQLVYATTLEARQHPRRR
jgi:multisubunit Na+/H+ antiporter MnhE subunit